MKSNQILSDSAINALVVGRDSVRNGDEFINTISRGGGGHIIIKVWPIVSQGFSFDKKYKLSVTMRRNGNEITIQHRMHPESIESLYRRIDKEYSQFYTDNADREIANLNKIYG